MKYFKLIIYILILFSFTSSQYAKELLIYADNIDYDSNKNLVAKGKVKLISKNEIITSELVIINELEKKIILPKEFRFKDSDDNYYYGTSGEFSSDFENGKITDIKMLLNDGSRIVGKEAYKTGKIDLINKGVITPCDSKIHIKDFLCPIWQVEGEKILHDRDNLFIHQKHAKMRILNFPVFYLPYMVTPSPLRKERKSGFLNPNISFSFLDTKSSQSTSLPYYVAIDQDKELLITPTFNYGGGVDASQKFVYEYDQIISGGNLSVDVSTETNFENQDNESWIRDSSLILNLNQNFNENFKYSFSSALQTSPTYLRRTNQNSFLNRSNSLSTSFDLMGYDVIRNTDRFNFNITGYQVVKDNEDNKTTPTSLPYVSYKFPNKNINNINYENQITFYNIFRDKATSEHAQEQQKLHHNLKTDKEFYKSFAKINFKTELHSQVYNTENKKINSEDYSGTYSRIFPMSGLYFETPIKHKKNNLLLTPKLSFIVNSSQSNSNKISNEESTNNTYTLANSSSLNRYTGTDKLDNSKRMNYGFEVDKNPFKFEINQSYEFDIDSDYSKDVGLKNYLSDLLTNFQYITNNNEIKHDSRINTDQGKIAYQQLSFINKNILGTSTINYLEEKKEVNTILESGSETLDLAFKSKEFMNYSSINLNSTFDLLIDDPKSYSIGYQYFDECFGLNVDFGRSFYEDRDLKPQDTLTIMFSFKNLGSYQSSNLAVSEAKKRAIKWENTKVDNERFK